MAPPRRPLLSLRGRPAGRLGLRGRLALLCAAAVAAAIAGVSTVAWVATSQALRAQVDASLTVPADGVRPAPGAGPGGFTGQPTTPGRPAADLATLLDQPVDEVCRTVTASRDLGSLIGGVQLVAADGTTCGTSSFGTLTPTEADRAAAQSVSELEEQLRDDVTSTGVPVRVRTVALGNGYALLVMRDLSDVDATLRQLGYVLVLVAALGSLAALAAGWFVARASLRPLDDLTAAVEHIAATQDLDVPIPAVGTDEIARLAVAFNQMTSSLSASRTRQQQLIVDASHELRTPLTSLRTNVELLARADATGRAIPAGQRHELLDSVVAQTAEMADLITELTVLAHDEPVSEPVPVDLDAVVERAVARAKRRGDRPIVSELRPWTVVGDPVALERAVLNLLDNAVKFSPPGSTVRVTLSAGALDVDDGGPGISPAERSHAFERFWRSPGARSLPGSGLGLAIVADAAAQHGGSAEILDSPLGGARLRLRLPGTEGHPH